MIPISDIIEGLEEEETLYCSVCSVYGSTCSIDCDYYISGNYGSECALHIVMETLQSRINNKKEKQ